MEKAMLVDKVIRKHVVIIHAYSLMSVLQRKIINVLLYEATHDTNRINHQDSVGIECRIPFNKLVKAVNFKSNNTQYLKEAIDGLASVKIEWNLLKDKVPTDISFLNLRVLHGSPTFYQDGTFNFSLHKIMLDLVQSPSIYGTVDLEVQSQFESKYGHSLYENSTRFVNLQKNKIIQLDTFRKLLGIDHDKYLIMREFTRNAITPAVEEVNDRASFIVNLDGVKAGRKIIGYELSVTSKKKSTLGLNFMDQAENKKILEEIKQIFGPFNETVLDSIFKSYSKEYIAEKMTYTQKFSKMQRSGFYPIPYFISALRNDYKSADSKQNFYSSIQVIPKIGKEVEQWQEQTRLLIAEINHWKKILLYRGKNSNVESADNIQRILGQYEDKLQQHYLQRPKSTEEMG